MTESFLLQNNVIITGGEDSKINVWSCPPSLLSQEYIGSKRENDCSDMDVDDEEIGSPSIKKRRF